MSKMIIIYLKNEYNERVAQFVLLIYIIIILNPWIIYDFDTLVNDGCVVVCYVMLCCVVVCCHEYM